MSPIVWMVAASVASCLAAMSVFEGDPGPEIALGMAGPLAAAAGTWMAVVGTHRRNPVRVTGLMIAAFAVKAVFFLAYVAFVLTVLDVREVPFVVSFTAYFISLYFIEALLFARLFTGRLQSAR